MGRLLNVVGKQLLPRTLHGTRELCQVLTGGSLVAEDLGVVARTRCLDIRELSVLHPSAGEDESLVDRDTLRPVDRRGVAELHELLPFAERLHDEVSGTDRHADVSQSVFRSILSVEEDDEVLPLHLFDSAVVPVQDAEAQALVGREHDAVSLEKVALNGGRTVDIEPLPRNTSAKLTGASLLGERVELIDFLPRRGKDECVLESGGFFFCP